jgi:two-component system CheB/CheR fusion protein
MNDASAQPRPAMQSKEYAVAGIGASAGGLAALQAFFERVPSNAGIAYVVVVHLSPQYESHIAELLQGVTALPVKQVTRPTHIEADNVYVISPRSHLKLNDGMLEPEAAPRPRGRAMTIDVFFETLAEAHKQSAMGIVLSGSGSDGTHGVRALRAQGGVTFAQEPLQAEYDAMPRSAIAAGVDFVLPVEEIPHKLASLWRNARAISVPDLPEQPSAEDAVAEAEQSLREILATVKTRTGHDFAHYKRSTLLRRLERRLQVTQMRDLLAYGAFIRDSATESQALLRDLLISVTSFFRDPPVYDYIQSKLVPEIFAGRRGGKIRVWVPGCATGEEAYSLAMLFAEFAQTAPSPPVISIFATDIDEEALASARIGQFADGIADHVSPERLRRWFVREKGAYRVQKQLREMVMFAPHNVIQDPPCSHLDLVSCRNLLIYLTRHVQSKVLDLLHFALRPDGVLVLGMSESVDEDHDGFNAVEKSLRIFSQQPRPRSTLRLTSLPVTQHARLRQDSTSALGRRMVSFGELHQRMLEHYAPPSVIVDDRYDVVHLSDSAGRYLKFGPGEASLNIVRAGPEEMRHEIKDALDQAMRTMRSVERRGVVSEGPEGGPLRLHVTVHPMRDRAMARTFALVLLDAQESGAGTIVGTGVEDPREASDAGLESRLRDTQMQLRGAVEQYEVQNEELKASNEELQATNEELRATTEELETGKEELQSINEELITVNQELKAKVDETTRVTDDLQNFILATGIAALFVDRDMHVLRYTPFARDIFNVIPTDIGRPLPDITHRLNGVDFEASITEVFETLRVVEQEARTSDGRWYIVRFLPYRTTDDRIGGAVMTFVDITQRKAAEASGERSDAWAKVMVDSVREYAILTLNADGVIQTWNPGAEQIFRFAADEAIGKPFSIIFTPEDVQAGTPEAELRVARESGRAEDERWQVRKDGTRFFASGICAPLSDPERFGYVKILRDLTEQQLAAQRRDELLALERAHRKVAEEANRAKDDFLATLSHEMRNPLALIQMQSELLLRAPEMKSRPRLASAVEIIHQTVRTQAQFVEDILDVSRLRTGKLAIDRTLLPLPLLIADSIGALRDEAEKNGITLAVEIDSEPMIVEADVVRVKQIAWNLISNAIKFTPHGGHVIVRLKREGHEARLDVEDNGVGIAPEVLPHIFDWFRQAESGSTRRKGGMGIGLALVKQLVELHGGRVRGRSSGLGRGACFSVWLPLQMPSTPAGLAAIASAMTDVPEAAAQLAGLRLLIIDDLADNASAMAELLQFEGAAVAVEVSAHAAIRRAANETFDVIISDLAMPEMDGYTMLGELRSSPLNASTPAIAYSGYGGAEEVERSRKAGFNVHLTKPVDVERLLAAIRSLVGRVAPQAPPQRAKPESD